MPSLKDAFKVLNYTTNELAYSPGGANPGFLYWLSWTAHNLNSFMSTGDVHGSVWRGIVILQCTSIPNAAVKALLGTLLGSTFGC